MLLDTLSLFVANVIVSLGMGVPSMRPPPPPPMMVGGMMPPRGPMMFVPAPRGPPHLAAMRGPMMMAMPGGVSAPPPPGTVDVPVPVVDLRETGPMNVFVGKLPPDLHDNYIRQLLEVSGSHTHTHCFVCLFVVFLIVVVDF